MEENFRQIIRQKIVSSLELEAYGVKTNSKTNWISVQLAGSSSSHGPGWKVGLECGLEGRRGSWLMVSSPHVRLGQLFQTLQQFHPCPKVSPWPAGIRHHGTVSHKPMRAAPLLQHIHIVSSVMEAHKLNSQQGLL